MTLIDDFHFNLFDRFVEVVCVREVILKYWKSISIKKYEQGRKGREELL